MQTIDTFNPAEEARIDRGAAFSWQRFGKFAGFMFPQLRKQMIIYAVTSAIFFILILMPFPGQVQFAVMSAIGTAIGFMLILSPISLAKGGDTRLVTRQLPVTAGEKYLFYLVYFLIIIPAIIEIPYILAQILYLRIPTIQDDAVIGLIKIGFEKGYVITLTNVMGTVCAEMTCFFFVMHSRSNRFLYGVLGALGFNILLAFAGGIWGLTTGIQDGMMDAAGNAQMTSEMTDQLAMGLLNDLKGWNSFTISLASALAAYLAVVFTASYRTIKYRDL